MIKKLKQKVILLLLDKLFKNFRMRKVNFLLLLLLLFSIGQVIIAQDFHFSQSYASPLSINPASTGNFKGDHRVICNYKDQWSSIAKSYKTVFASADFVVFRKKKSGNFIGAGLSFYNDKAGKSKMGTTQINLSIAYNIKLDKNSFFAAGFQFGYAQKGVDLNNLKWDNQYNGTAYDPNLTSGETYFGEQINYMDFGAGLLWNFIPDEKRKVTIGASLSHVNKPNQLFSKIYSDPLNPKIALHGSAQFKLGEKNVSLIPLVLFTNQGKLNEINAGGMLKYGKGLGSKYTGTNKPSSVSFGSLYRIKDAIIILINVDYKSMFTFGFSYDINVSNLATASQGRGGIELCIAYSGFFNSEK